MQHINWNTPQLPSVLSSAEADVVKAITSHLSITCKNDRRLFENVDTGTVLLLFEVASNNL